MDDFFYANRLYQQIAQQLRGLYFKDGGPVIGIQIENEYQHSAAPWSLTYTGSKRELTAARFDREIIQAGVGVNEMGNDYLKINEPEFIPEYRIRLQIGAN
jgi:beta-galactosidase